MIPPAPGRVDCFKIQMAAKLRAIRDIGLDLSG
jgi:hypothetical protein